MTVDLTNCDREPIHVPGSIQPHGSMLVCDPETSNVIYASENAERWLGKRNSSIVGLSLAEVLGAHAAHDLRNAAAKAGGSHLAGVLLGLQLANVDDVVDAVVHQHRDRLFVEIEPTSLSGAAAKEALDMTQSLVRRIGRESSVEHIVATGAKLIRGVLGYDRVMVYQFLHNGAGRVIAEAKSSRLGSFMGQHFPASDIPEQARRLYLLNTIRMIGDVSFAPIPLEPPQKAGDCPVDMSFAQLRSVSPIHCEYLRNMGVAASMSISVIVDGELWGLISCHHDSPKVVPIPLRVAAELFGQYFSMQIALAERRAALIAANETRDKLGLIVADVEPDEPIDEAVTRHLADLASLTDCDGAAIWISGNWTSIGRAPPREDVEDLIAAISINAAGKIWNTTDVRALAGADGNYGSDVAGLLAIPLSAVPQDYLIFFRSEEAFDVEWAGKPGKRVVSGPSGDRLSPRGSFETWREEVRGRSKPWTDAELAVAEAIRTYLRDVVLRHTETTAEERDRTERRRRVLNDELNHRVKNIISLVKSIALQTGAHAESVEDYSASMEGRLRALAYAHDQSLAGGEGGDLETLIEAEAGLHRYGGSADRVATSGPPVGLTDRSFGVIALVIHELMTNAAKYGSLSVSDGRLNISWVLSNAGVCELSWVERNGPVVAVPTRVGFGSKLVESTIKHDLGGSVSIDYSPDGVRVELAIPREYVTVSKGAALPLPMGDDGVTLSDLDILLVEDQALIAMDTEETLRRLGARSVRVASGVRQAMTELDAARPDCAVLDFNLGDGTSTDIADQLASLAIPFIFATGYGDTVLIPERFRSVPIVRKPVSGTTLADKLDLVLSMRL